MHEGGPLGQTGAMLKALLADLAIIKQRDPAALSANSEARLRRNGEAIWASIDSAITARKRR